MFWAVLIMLLALVIAVGVIGVVAIPARQSGRALFTPRGRRVVRASQSRASNVRLPSAPKVGLGKRTSRQTGQEDSSDLR